MEDKPTLEERGRALRVIINRVRGRIAEQERLLSELEAHAMLLELGIDPELIDTFNAPSGARTARLRMKDGSVLRVPREVIVR